MNATKSVSLIAGSKHVRDKLSDFTLNIDTDEIPKVSEARNLGEGGFGVVTLGRLRKPDGSSVTVAVKRAIKNINNKICLEEAKIMAQFDHENVVNILAFQENPPIIAMEYMEWGCLIDALEINIERW
ncbi:hypothetical protein NQ314_008951 [Rhamnusium bicolor]|uniref:Protein kinase domain-containing protein n=1 Tax=Rhamnusium bicolor TaxID=1586634 RepID=A0AAV8Y6R8_9CUCU|nr:hypothetical protein NQ314_008951 [Rhamnusium bicolor]